jgi:hypothetical protein
MAVNGGTKPVTWVALLVASLLLASCGGIGDSEAGLGSVRAKSSSPPDEPTAEPDLVSPPPVTVRYFDRSIDLAAWTYCYEAACVDGFPPKELADVGSPEQVVVEFPLPTWSFTASFRPSGDECGRIQDVPLEETDDGDFILRPAGYAGSYDVTLFGEGVGDLFVTFRWTTPHDGPLPKPEARLAVLADHDGRVDSYGVELYVSNLARTPRKPSATITVRAETGREVTFEAIRADQPCLPEGTVYWDGPDDQGLAASRLGGGPFTYEVELMIDGVTYSATASWPADVIVGNEPSVALHFRPELPGFSQ